MKITIVGGSSCCSNLFSVLTNQNKIEYHLINIKYSTEYFDQHMLSPKDIWHIQTSDAIALFGTWGSNNRNRVWHPKDNVRRQAFTENINTFFTGVAKLYNKKVIVFETATLSRVRQVISGTKHWKDEQPRYYRMGLNHWTYGSGKFCKPKKDRLSKFIQSNQQYENALSQQFFNHQWKNNKNGKIVIFVGLENDPTSTMPGPEFVKKSVETIKKHTNKQICIKPHPLSKYRPEGYEIIDNTITIKELASQLYCAVLDNSTSIFELTFAGIPCFTTKANFGYSLGNNDLSKINDIYYKSVDEMKNWYNEMAHTEFLLTEYKDPIILEYIKELINE